ncbi:MAG: flagellar assembly protein FliH [Gammaproteobacteria bacterium]|nr:flagellar assembly protein FliH [Gammaproteobacteria bacterium]MBU1602868.1 flagellar assembly protein FliH [Gammaproteobacteria bacterium]MBU2432540.1 flagellar assembly protein FliH [Gammaproteobacteria bacterium]MBU2448917.1 flagellar assembly protein FliH [Gammaproteobacteria bacterium]
MPGSVIPKDKLTSYQRWSIGSLDAQPATGSQPPSVSPDKAERTAPPPVSGPAEPEPAQAQNSAEELERIREEARADGHSLGYSEGLEAGRQAMAATAAETTAYFAELVGNLQTSLAHLDQHVADQVLNLALEVAAQVLRGAISTRPELLLPVIREAISALPLHHAHVVIRMNPADAPVIREQIGDQLSQTGAQIIDDPEVSPGGCILVAGASEVDATIETRWRRVLESIGVAPSEWMNRL